MTNNAKDSSVKRVASISLALVVVLLCATASTIYARAMDGLSVAWFIAVAMISGVAAACLVMELFQQFTRSQMRTSLDGFFWIFFLALPISAILCATAVWTLAAYFLDWE